MSFYAGVDGCARGWVVAALNSSREFAWVQVCQRFEEVLAITTGSELVLVDIPIGLPGQETSPTRLCDVEARRRLGPRRGSSVFPTPTRKAVYATTCEEAGLANLAVTGRKISRQAWGICGKIAEVDRLFRANPELQIRVRETHPEVCFAALNGWHPMGSNKKSAAGRELRLQLLEGVALNTGRVLMDTLAHHGRADMAADDVLDAMVAAVTARSEWSAPLVTLPAKPAEDEYGLRMEIICPSVSATSLVVT